MKRVPVISIAIPTYNEEANIRRCLSSIFHQTYRGKLEVFVIDGGSTDRTVEIAKGYPVYILKNPVKEAEYGKKIGLTHATGTYFMILDSDMDLVGERWFEKMVEPLENDKTIVGSWTKFVAQPEDATLNKFITLDPIQRDPLFRFLTPSIEQCVTLRTDRYWIVEYKKDRMLPAGFCLYRRKELLATEIKDMEKFMELDNLVILLNHQKRRYAYVQNIGIHHPFLTMLGNLIRKRKRNLETMYFNQPNKRYWTWIDWNNPYHLVRIIFWILYCYSIFPSLIVGIIKSIKYKTWTGMYELPFNIMTTTTILWSFMIHFVTPLPKRS